MHPQRSSQPILVVGGANLDRLARAVGPVVLGTSVPVTTRQTFGGVARNVAENLARLGVGVCLMTAVGDDPEGKALLEHARGLGVDTHACLVVPGRSTGSYTALLRSDGEMVVALADMAVVDGLTPTFLRGRRDVWTTAAVRVLDLNLPRETLSLLLRERQDALQVVVGVSESKMDRLPMSLAGISTLILNAGELAARLGRSLPDPTAVLEACPEVLSQGAERIVVTLGGDGVVCADACHRPTHFPAPQVAIVDVTGAGDAFAAGVVAALARNPEDLHGACRLGQTLATLTLESASSVSPKLTPDILEDPGAHL